MVIGDTQANSTCPLLFSSHTFMTSYFYRSQLKHMYLHVLLSPRLSSGVQLVNRPHGGLVRSLYLLSSCCFTCRSVLQGDSLALA